MPGHHILAGNERYTRHRRRRRLIVRAIKSICIPPADGRGLIRRKAWQLLQRDEFNRGVNRTFPPTVFARTVDRAEARPRVLCAMQSGKSQRPCISRTFSIMSGIPRLERKFLRLFLQPLTAQGGGQRSFHSLFLFPPSTLRFPKLTRKIEEILPYICEFFFLFHFSLLCNNKWIH